MAVACTALVLVLLLITHYCCALPAYGNVGDEFVYYYITPASYSYPAYTKYDRPWIEDLAEWIHDKFFVRVPLTLLYVAPYTGYHPPQNPYKPSYGKQISPNQIYGTPTHDSYQVPHHSHEGGYPLDNFINDTPSMYGPPSSIRVKRRPWPNLTNEGKSEAELKRDRDKLQQVIENIRDKRHFRESFGKVGR